MRVALLGGSFNPPHVGHLLAAQFVHATQDVDEVWLMPSFHHPFHKALAPFEHRVAMCQLLAVESSGWLRVSEVEKDVGGEGYTVETLAYLREQRSQDEFILVVGSDILADLPKWHELPRIKSLARFLVLNRAGHPSAEGVGPPLAEVSSTAIRAALSRGERPEGLVPRRVLEYLEARALYSAGK